MSGRKHRQNTLALYICLEYSVFLTNKMKVINHCILYRQIIVLYIGKSLYYISTAVIPIISQIKGSSPLIFSFLLSHDNRLITSSMQV